MQTGTVIGLIAAGAVLIGLGLFAVIMTIKGMLAAKEPDVQMRMNNGRGVQLGRPGLVVLTILGIVLVVAGIALLVNGIRLAS